MVCFVPFLITGQHRIPVIEEWKHKSGRYYHTFPLLCTIMTFICDCIQCALVNGKWHYLRFWLNKPKLSNLTNTNIHTTSSQGEANVHNRTLCNNSSCCFCVWVICNCIVGRVIPTIRAFYIWANFRDISLFGLTMIYIKLVLQCLIIATVNNSILLQTNAGYLEILC